jgi:sphinganine-1-phosphate aldolase
VKLHAISFSSTTGLCKLSSVDFLGGITLAMMDSRALLRDGLAVLGAGCVAYQAISLVRYLVGGGTLTSLASSSLKTVVGGAVATLRALPLASSALDAGLDGALDGLRDELAPVSATSLRSLPKQGRRASAVLGELKECLAQDAVKNGLLRGTAFGGIYHVLGKEPPLHALHAGISEAFLDTNQLYPGLFRTARRVEAEAVAMAVSVLKNGGDGSGGGAPAPNACGLFTSGGTESVILAVKAHRDAALGALGLLGGGEQQVPPLTAAARGGRVLNVVAGTTVHPAFDKACALLGLVLRKVAVEPGTLAFSPKAAAQAMDAGTVLLVASAPGFAHGVVDDVVGLGCVALAHATSPFGVGGVPLHVDNCLGGLLLSFMPGSPPPFDFRASPAIASISMDIHKYAGAPKGASIVAFRCPTRRRAAYSVTTDYPGGLYATPTLMGSRSGAAAALAWGTLVTLGEEGLTRGAQRVACAFEVLLHGLRGMPLLEVLGTPSACCIAFAPAVGRGARFSIFSLAARLERLGGWRLALIQAPEGAHVVVTERFAEAWEGGQGGASTTSSGSSSGTSSVDDGKGEGGGVFTVGHAWLRDVRACVEAAQREPRDPAFEGQGEAAIYGAAGVLPKGEVGEVLRRYCDVLTVVR